MVFSRAGAKVLVAASAVLAAMAVAAPATVQAWIWPEHRDIAAEALKDLPSAQQRTLEKMWVGVRALGTRQVCEKLVDPGADRLDARKYFGGSPD